MRLLRASFILGVGLCACTTPNPDFLGSDAPMSRADGSLFFPVFDQAARAPELSPPPPPPPRPEDASPAKPPFGQICTGEGTCPEGELCIFVEDNAQKGICLRTCDTFDAPCAVPDPEFHSGCALYYNASVKVKVCAIFCHFPNKKTFPCPNATDYRCKVFKDGLGMCAPK